MKIAIVGDSFAADDVEHSWISLLQAQHQITNYSQRGISQYRLLTIVEENLSSILEHDCVIVWHTNPDRVYVNNDITFPTRTLASHPCADLVAADSLSSSDTQWRRTAETYYRVFHDTQQQQLYHHLVVQYIQKLMQNIQSVHCSGFALPGTIYSWSGLVQEHPGHVNHLDIAGNQIVFEHIAKQLKRNKA
jgi:hypothetical protein